jgi:uncharacterized membrane protein
MDTSRLYLAGFLLVLAGIALLFIGNAGSSSASFGAVVFIGPFPIAFGSGPDAGTLILIGVVVSIAMVLIFFLSLMLSRRFNSPGHGTGASLAPQG